MRHLSEIILKCSLAALATGLGSAAVAGDIPVDPPGENITMPSPLAPAVTQTLSALAVSLGVPEAAQAMQGARPGTAEADAAVGAVLVTLANTVAETGVPQLTPQQRQLALQILVDIEAEIGPSEAMTALRLAFIQ